MYIGICIYIYTYIYRGIYIYIGYIYIYTVYGNITTLAMERSPFVWIRYISVHGLYANWLGKTPGWLELESLWFVLHSFKTLSNHCCWQLLKCSCCVLLILETQQQHWFEQERRDHLLRRIKDDADGIHPQCKTHATSLGCEISWLWGTLTSNVHGWYSYYIHIYIYIYMYIYIVLYSIIVKCRKNDGVHTQHWFSSTMFEDRSRGYHGKSLRGLLWILRLL